jgi:D-tyrosyl-tRNA(Tyr) deacylase
VARSHSISLPQSRSMRMVVQRVLSASVQVGDEVVGEIGRGLCLLVGIAEGDGVADVDAVAAKVSQMRIFPDRQDRMNLSVLDIEGEVLVVSQFTLLADLRRGRRPSFDAAADPEEAELLIERLVTRFEELGIETAQGVFGAKMEVELINDGPVTVVLDVRQGAVA